MRLTPKQLEELEDIAINFVINPDMQDMAYFTSQLLEKIKEGEELDEEDEEWLKVWFG